MSNICYNNRVCKGINIQKNFKLCELYYNKSKV